MIALEGRAPVREDLLKLTTLKVWLDKIFRGISQPYAIEGRIERRLDIVQGQLAIHPDAEFVCVFVELPGIYRAQRWQPQVDALVVGQFLGLLGVE
ncbi:hypothetical protein FB009_106152 [Sinorhizobium medicae]|nr:hypothetical protein FB009_106152 [Sinorhizobium medicae]